ncbi:hypothetical protein [Streptomyces violaceusniger]|uniref:Uncharacterized protein n=1 Tax=Streptomyces violaceusniger (strain Tu 4113) TaxID=653045 RepID=G2NWH3_STRV4|nr:hypothetical protein [Streptomyces violaceusniger]AEM86858.1 hypothetical protein Strvi_7507 [Streptomyces violaceusniger Tu 4113]
MRHRRQDPAVRAALLAYRAVRLGLLLSVIPALLVLAIYLCIAGDPYR